MPMLYRAKEQIYLKGILPRWVNISLSPWDDRCEASYAQIATIDAYAHGECVNAIFGLICDYCLGEMSSKSTQSQGHLNVIVVFL